MNTFGDGCNDKFSAFSIRDYGDDGPHCGTLIPRYDSLHKADVASRCARFVQGVSFVVYNRWGREVYEYQSNGENSVFIDWDGRDNNGRDVDSGTYYFVANVSFYVVDPKRKNRTIKGWVQIIR